MAKVNTFLKKNFKFNCHFFKIKVVIVCHLKNSPLIDLETIKAICKQSDMWELDNPRVVGMINNIIKCIEQEEDIKTKQRLSN